MVALRSLWRRGEESPDTIGQGDGAQAPTRSPVAPSELWGGSAGVTLAKAEVNRS